jgi:GH35 family endo-1,4-beta-xylanase
MKTTSQSLRLAGYVILFLTLGLSAAPNDTLRHAADQAHPLIGSAVRPSLFPEAAYSAALSHEYNMIEPEDVMKWWVVRRDRGFDFQQGDEVVRFAQAQGMKVR